MTSQRFIPYARQSISSSDIEEVSIALSSEIITRGPYVEDFEQAIADYCGAKFSVAFNSGTSALIAACHAAQLGPGDRVISTPNTFASTVTSAMHCQATPIFVDIDLETGNLNLEQVEATLKDLQSTRGKTVIMPVHFSGIPVDMESLDRMICDPETIVIEDAAHALGSRYLNGQRVGCCAWSQMTVFSFHPAKTITTGEGGMVLTNDADLFHRLCSFRNNGIERDQNFLQGDKSGWFDGYYEAMEMSGNYNFTEFQAALGLSQLNRIDKFIAKRLLLTKTYQKLLSGTQNIKLFDVQENPHIAFHLFVAQIDFSAYNTTRAIVMSKLKEKDIGTQLHYIPVYHHPFFKNKFGDIKEYFPHMETYYSQALSLPLYYDLTVEEVEYIVHTLKDILTTEQRKSTSRESKQQPHPHGRPTRYKHHRK